MRLLVRILSVLALSVWAGSALAQAPEIISIGNEEILPGGFSRRVPGIDVDPLNQPHIAFDGGSSVVLFDKIGGSWINTALDVGGYGSGQYFNPAVQVTPNNIEFVSGVLYGSQMGIGVITRSSVSTSPSGIGFSAKRIIPNSFDVGNLSTDPAFPNDVVVWVSEGYWGDYTYDLTVGGWTRLIANGQMWAGHGGEKNAFWISKAGNVLHADGTSHGIWHAAIGGWDKWDSSYNNSFRVAQHLDPVTWANFAQYPSQNDDGAYVSVTSDNKDPQTAYITAAYAGVVMNIWNGSSMVFSPANLLTIDPNGGSGLRRFAPQLCPSKNGGCWVTWTAGAFVKMRYVSPKGEMGNITTVSVGALSAICSDKQGNLHVAYTVNGSPRYRKILLAGGGDAATLAGDFNGDGKDDLALYDLATGKWYIQDVATGNNLVWGLQFGKPGEMPLVGDFNGDGKSELAIYDSTNSSWSIATTNLTLLVNHRVFGHINGIPFVGDFDGDGKDDIGVFDPIQAKWYVQTATSAVTLVNGTNWGFNGVQIVPGDYDGDGKADLGVYDPATGQWYVRKTDGTVIAWAKKIAPAGSTALPGNYLAPGKFDLAAYNSGNNMWYVRAADDNSEVSTATQWGFPGALPVRGDFNGDGIMDFGIYDPSQGKWYIQQSAGTNIHALAAQWGGFNGATPVPADYNGDGKADLAIYHMNVGNWYVHSIGGSTLLWAQNWGFAGAAPVPGDYNGDSNSDLAVFSAGNWYIHTLGAGASNMVRSWGWNGAWPVQADYNGDGKTDLGVFNAVDGKWYIRGVNGTVLAFGRQWGWNGAWPVPADYNGDGKADLGVFNPYNGNWYVQTLAGANLLWAHNWGFYGSWPVQADYNGDGKAELAVFNPTTGQWYIEGMGAGAFGRQWGYSGTVPYPHDYFGDGKADLAVYDPQSGWWYIQKLSDTYSSILFGRQFGAPGMVPMGGSGN